VYSAQKKQATRALRTGLDGGCQQLTQSFSAKGRPYEFTQLGGEAGFVVVTCAPTVATAPPPVMMEDGGYVPDQAYPPPPVGGPPVLNAPY
jgi:hypothetical protein